MSKIVLYPANGYDFDAADVAAYLAGLTSGVFSSAEDFPVTAAGGLKVTVGAGRGWVHPSRFTGYSITKREADTLTMPLADPSLPRIDCIVMRYDAGARAASLQVLQGTASSTPTAPAISRTELIYDLCLAEITRPAGSTNITTGQITDTRLDEALCGIVRDGVTGIPTEELIASARERINALEETASAAAKEANASKTAAAQSEANAKAYKEAAATSEHNAAGSASASAGSAAAAARSENAAAGSATAAANSASAAEKSKTAAATSEINAARYEEAAKQVVTQNAKGYGGGYSRTFTLTAPQAGWTALETPIGIYRYYADVALADCTAKWNAFAAVLPESAMAAFVARVANIIETKDGSVRLYAVNVPDGDVKFTLSVFAVGSRTYSLTVPVNGWVQAENTVGVNQWQCDLTLEDSSVEKVPMGMAALENTTEALSTPGLSATMETFDGYIRVYAKKRPAVDINIVVILLAKNEVN